MVKGACTALQSHGSTLNHSPKIIPDSIACRLYLLTVLIETAIDLAIEGDLLKRLYDFDKGSDNVSRKMPVYLAVFATAQYVPSLSLVSDIS